MEKTIKTKYFETIKAMGSVQRNATNPFAKAKYASLSNIQKHLAPILQDQKCYVLFDFGTLTDQVYDVTLTLCDAETDASMVWRFAVPIDNTQKNHVQAFGATTTYAQRYALCVAFQIALDDEDPDAKSPTQPAQPAAPKPAPKVLPELHYDTDAYRTAVRYLAEVKGWTIERVQLHYRLTEAVKKKLLLDAANYQPTETETQTPE
jgi:hypothetical protein